MKTEKGKDTRQRIPEIEGRCRPPAAAETEESRFEAITIIVVSASYSLNVGPTPLPYEGPKPLPRKARIRRRYSARRSRINPCPVLS